MATIRQEKIAELIQQELSIIFQKEARNICLGAMVSTTIVRVAPDLSTAKVYLSIFGNKDKQAVLQSIKDNKSKVKHALSQVIKMQLRKTPDLSFYLDDSLDYAMEIESLLKK
jgi:ribosome-binding factor A